MSLPSFPEEAVTQGQESLWLSGEVFVLFFFVLFNCVLFMGAGDNTCVQARGQIMGISFLLLLYGCKGWSFGHQAVSALFTEP